MHRPEAAVLIDVAVVLDPGPSGRLVERQMSVQMARAWAAAQMLETSQGTVAIGDALTAAWDDHVPRWRQARASVAGSVPA